MLDEAEQLSGKLIKGKARSAGFVFLIPTRFYDDVVLEFHLISSMTRRCSPDRSSSP